MPNLCMRCEVGDDACLITWAPPSVRILQGLISTNLKWSNARDIERMARSWFAYRIRPRLVSFLIHAAYSPFIVDGTSSWDLKIHCSVYRLIASVWLSMQLFEP